MLPVIPCEYALPPLPSVDKNQSTKFTPCASSLSGPFKSDKSTAISVSS